MRKVIAAIDDTAAARSVLATGRLVAELFEASLEAVHVRDDGARTARTAAAVAGLQLREVDGPVVDALVLEARASEVAALTLGARATPAGRRPAGHVALEVITAVPRPVAVVPPDVRPQRDLRRLVVPLNGTWATANALAGVIELACRCDLDVVILHVLDEESLPPFSDQPHHEAEAWLREFMARQCPAAAARAELRVGVPAHAVEATAVEMGADLIALSWSQELAPGRAAVVREVLERGRIPVLLVPIRQGNSERAP
ncbi:MAG TPA: universal stress protein [Actinomycetota bacterium]|nr:universal stress protein [Actinomycetota bacterium]